MHSPGRNRPRAFALENQRLTAPRLRLVAMVPHVRSGATDLRAARQRVTSQGESLGEEAEYVTHPWIRGSRAAHLRGGAPAAWCRGSCPSTGSAWAACSIRRGWTSRPGKRSRTSTSRAIWPTSSDPRRQQGSDVPCRGCRDHLARGVSAASAERSCRTAWESLPAGGLSHVYRRSRRSRTQRWAIGYRLRPSTDGIAFALIFALCLWLVFQTF